MGDAVKIWPEVAPGAELQLLGTAQNLQLGPLAPALLQAAQKVVTLGQQITQLLLSNAGLIAVAAVLVIIATVAQNCLVADGNAFSIPQEAFLKTSNQSSSTSAASCAPKSLQPFCLK